MISNTSSLKGIKSHCDVQRHSHSDPAFHPAHHSSEPAFFLLLIGPRREPDICLANTTNFASSLPHFPACFVFTHNTFPPPPVCMGPQNQLQPDEPTFGIRGGRGGHGGQSHSSSSSLTDSHSNAVKQKPSFPVSHQLSFNGLKISSESTPNNTSVVTPEKAPSPNLFMAVTNKKHRNANKDSDQSAPAIPDNANMPDAAEFCKHSASTDRNQPSQIKIKPVPNCNNNSADEADTENNLFPESEDKNMIHQARSRIKIHAPHLLQDFNVQVDVAMTA
jgi:hypothetical protein